MRDAVAEVLEQRQSIGLSRSTFVALSLLAHVGLASAFITAASRQASRPARPVINVRLAGGAAAAPRSLPAPARKSETKPAVAPEQKPVTPPKTSATPEPEPVKPAKRTSEGRSLFGRSELEPAKQATSAKPPAQPSTGGTSAGTTPGTSRSAIPGVGKAGVTALEGGPFPYSLYVDRMVSLIGTRWFRPDTGELLADVYFIVERDGRIRDVKIEKSSGNSVFDRAAYRAVLESSPLPPLPAAYSGDYLGVHLTFH